MAYNRNYLMELLDEIEYMIREIIKTLTAAMNWSYVDILGGGIFVSSIKRGLMDKCQNQLHILNKYMSLLKNEIMGMGEKREYILEEYDRLFLYDIIFDNIFSDILVHRNLTKKLKMLKDALEDTRQLKSYVKLGLFESEYHRIRETGKIEE